MPHFELDSYPSILPQINLTADEIHSQISRFQLSFMKLKDDMVEWGMKFPMFVDSFYDFLMKNQRMPEQAEAFNYYLEFNKEFFADFPNPELMPALEARFRRSYPSLVRDIHFNKFIEEKLGTKCQIIYNMKLDVEGGIDLMIITKRNNYGICFFTNTRRAYEGRKAKEHRHTPFDNVCYVEMPVDFQGSVKAGAFFLYGEKEYTQLYNLLSTTHGKKCR